VASSAYMQGRRMYARPQAMLWSDNSGTLQNGLYAPLGTEFEDFIILTDHNRSEISVSKQRIESRQRMINGTMRSYFNADKVSMSVSWQALPSRSFEHKVPFDSSGKFPQVIKTATYGIGENSLEVVDTQNLFVGMTVRGRAIKNNTKIADIDNVARIVTLSQVTSQLPDPDGEGPEGSPEGFTNEPVIFGTTQYIVDAGASGSDMLEWYDLHPGPFWVFLSYDKNGDNLYMYNDIRQMYFASFEHSIIKRGSNNHDFWSVSVTLEEV